MIDCVNLTTWRAQIGVSRATIYNWRKQGWFKLLKLNGRLYVPRATLDEFARRMVVVPE